MAADGPGGEKTEKPTPQRLKKARKEGQIPRTPELGTWIGVAVASVMLPMLVGKSFTTVQQLFVKVGAVAKHPETSAISDLMGEALSGFLTTLLPTALALMLAGVVATAAQGGVSVSGKSLKPSLKKLNPFKGIKRMFGAQGLWEATKALIKTAALAAVVMVTVGKAKALVSSAGALPLSSVAGTFADCAVLLMRTVAITGLVIAIADYVIVRTRTMKQLKMSKYEIQQEHKQSEGDPHMKAHRRAVQMSMSRNRMMSDVKEADVLLVNPTHVAVALRYEPQKGAPRVVAKGQGPLATKIRELAAEHRVPMVEDKPLARTLYKAVEVGHEIPAEFFGTVAKVLAFVMS